MRWTVALVFLFTPLCYSQNTQASTAVPCSIANTGNDNKISINCGIGREQGQKMLAILNKILANQLDPDAVITKLDDISKDVKRLRRGVSSRYDFNGVLHEQRPGITNTTIGDDYSAFQKMVDLHQKHDWTQLLQIAEERIKKTPDWLTPYLFSGIANANLGNKQAAIDRLKFVEEESAGDSAYADAGRILRELQQQQ